MKRSFATPRVVLAVLAMPVAAALVAGILTAGDEPAAAREAAPAREAATEKKLRVGTFDNRAIAVAFAHSRWCDVGELMAEYKKAEEAKDTKRMEELKKQGSKRQDRMHRQGFGRAPVDDLLAKIKDKLPEVCKEARVELIAWDIVHAGPSVELVDVTDNLVKRFEPKEETLKIIEELKKHAPLDDDQFPIDD